MVRTVRSPDAERGRRAGPLGAGVVVAHVAVTARAPPRPPAHTRAPPRCAHAVSAVLARARSARAVMGCNTIHLINEKTNYHCDKQVPAVC